jgi:hypothetical protein
MKNWKFHFWSNTCWWKMFSCSYGSFHRIYIKPTYNQCLLFARNIFASTFTLNFILKGKIYNEPASLLVPMNCFPLCALDENKKKTWHILQLILAECVAMFQKIPCSTQLHNRNISDKFMHIQKKNSVHLRKEFSYVFSY